MVNKFIKNTIVLTVSLLNFSFLSYADTINLENSAFIYSVGGSGNDIYEDGVENSKGELISVGYTASGSDIGSSSLGKDDGLLTKHNQDGTLAWIKRIGGSGRDRFTSIVLNDDDSVVVAGRSKSMDNGFFTNGDYDAIIAKISDDGDILWIKNWGGTTFDGFVDIIKTSDGGYLAVGESDSVDSEDPSSGMLDFLIVKYDALGNKEWAKTYGGSNNDSATSAIEVDDGYIIVGESASTDAGFVNNGYVDAIVMKVNKSGLLQWIKNIGGGPYDSFRSITNTEDGFICVGETYTNNNQIENNGPSGTRDAFLVKYDLFGNVEFIKTFGGTGGEVFTQIVPTHLDTYMAIGYSDSSDSGFVNRGMKDIIMVEYDKDGNKLKVNSFGGNGDEEIDKGIYTVDGSLVFFGESDSSNLGFENKGNRDAIIFKYNIDIEEAVKAVIQAENSRHPLDIDEARDKVSKLPESIHQKILNDRIDTIVPLEDAFPEFELKTTTANLDLYIKSENMLSLSLDTNNITFEDFGGVEDMEKLNAVNLMISSSLPYQVNAYLATEIQNSDKSNTMNKSIFNIKANSELTYKVFSDTVTPIVLLDNQPKGNDIIHGINIKLKGGIAHEKNLYKTTIKFEVNQK